MFNNIHNIYVYIYIIHIYKTFPEISKFQKWGTAEWLPVVMNG